MGFLTHTTQRAMFVALAALVFLAGLPGVARPIQLDDFQALVRLSSPRVAPDGEHVVVVVSRANVDENRFENELVLVNVKDRTQRPLTHKRHTVRQPRWSPTGDRLAFVAQGQDTPQVFVLPMTGGEAHQVTQAPQGVVTFEWAAEGKSLIYLGAGEPAEAPEGTQRHNKSFVVGHHAYQTQEKPAPVHVWIAPLDGGAAQQVSSEQTVAALGLFTSLTVSPDGAALAFAGYPREQNGNMRQAALQVVRLESPPKLFDNSMPLITRGTFSPDGRKLAYSKAEVTPFFSSHSIWVKDVTGGKPRKVSEAIDRTFYSAAWMPDGSSLILTADDGARTSIWQQPLEGRPRKLDLGEINARARFDGSDVHVGRDGSLAMIGLGAYRPAELYHLPSAQAQPQRLTNFNGAIAELELGRVEEIQWNGPNDFRENGIVIYPPGFRSDRRYPLVLQIHGGPMTASTLAFDVVGQLLAARGWVVFKPNYRGSSNLGNRYQSAVIGNAGDGPAQDVMAGLETLKDRGFIDERRVAVSGWSYGGYMTSWLIGHHPEVWTAAVAGAPVTDYVDQYTLSDVNVGFGWGFTELPWSEIGQESWRRQSPISSIHRAKTPTLILCNTGDLRVPITESYKLYHALNDNGVPVEFVAYPVPGHFPGDPVHAQDVYRRWGDWIERWFTSDAP